MTSRRALAALAAIVIVLMAVAMLDRCVGSWDHAGTADETPGEPAGTKPPTATSSESYGAEGVVREPLLGNSDPRDEGGIGDDRQLLLVRAVLHGSRVPADGADVWVLERRPSRSRQFDALFAGPSYGAEWVREHGAHYRCDASGLAWIPVPEEDFALVVSHPEGEYRAKEIGRLPSTAMEAVLTQRASVEVQVLDAEGRVVPGHPVSAFSRSEGKRRGAIRRYTDDSGRVVLDLAASIGRVWTLVSGYPSSPADTRLVDLREYSGELIEFTIRAGRSVRFEIVDAFGEPYLGRTVVLVRCATDIPPEGQGVAERLASEVAFVEQTTFDGNLIFAALPNDGNLEYTVLFQDFEATVEGTIPPSAPETESPVSIPVVRPSLESGFIGSWIDRTDRHELTRFDARLHCGDDSESFAVELHGNGAFLLDASVLGTPESELCDLEIWAPPAPAVGTLDYYLLSSLPFPQGAILELPPLDLPGSGVVASGHVVDREGNPVPGARIALATLSSEEGRWRNVWPPEGRVVLFTDSDGRFEIRGRAETESIRVTATAPGLLPSQLVAEPGATELLLQLRNDVGIPIEVLADAGMSDGISLRIVRDTRSGPEPLYSSSTGKFIPASGKPLSGLFLGVPPGVHEVQASSGATGETFAFVERIVVTRDSAESDARSFERLNPLDLRGKLTMKRLVLECEDGPIPPGARLMMDNHPIPHAQLSPSFPFLTAQAAPEMRLIAPGYSDASAVVAAEAATLRLTRAPEVTVRVVGIEELVREHTFHLLVFDDVTQFSVVLDDHGTATFPVPRDVAFSVELWQVGVEPTRFDLESPSAPDGAASIPPPSRPGSEHVTLKASLPSGF